MWSYSERSHWDEKDVEDCMKTYCAKPELWFFENRNLPVITVREKTSNCDPEKFT